MTLKQNLPSSAIVRYKNARLVKDGKLSIGDLWVQDSRIINPEPIFYQMKKSADITIDCKQMIISPGYIDVQVNGGWGYDFSNKDVNIEEAIKVVSTNLVKHGVTAYCPTLITQPADNYRVLLPKIKRGAISNGATVLGVHLEGPFINVKKKGAHPEVYIQNQVESIKQVEKHYHDFSNVSIVTIAPELDQNDVVKKLSEKGLVVSLGHSNASLEESERAFRNGASMITHLFNAMPLFHHRDPGLLGLLTVNSDRQIYYGIIADSIHTHYSALRLAFHANQAGMVLVSDAISAAGLESGIHMIGTQKVEIKDNKAFVAETDTLCGSIALQDFCVRYLRQMVHCSLVEAIECATLHPAQVLGIEHKKGTLAFDSDADFILLNDRLEVQATFVAGHCVYQHPQSKLLLENVR